jgi:Zn finger protein HypA/HybF involved in hydrogenase expression
MKSKTSLKVIIVIAVLYLIWLFVVAANDVIRDSEIVLSLRMWSVIGVLIYALFLVLEIVLYLMSSRKAFKEIKLVSETINKVVCSHCHSMFTISDPGNRPIPYVCPHCERSGVLKGRKTGGTTTHITCNQCSTAFEILDAEDHPLTYECPSCHHYGVVE